MNQLMALSLLALLLVAGCSISDPSSKRIAATQESRDNPSLLGLTTPITITGCWVPFFDGQIRGLEIRDVHGTEFIVSVPVADEADRAISIMRSEGVDYSLKLWREGATERSLIKAIRDAFARQFNSKIEYAPRWNDGVHWPAQQQYIHIFRYVEFEKKIADNKQLSDERNLLFARLEKANADKNLAELEGRKEDKSNSVDQWHQYREALFKFHDDVAEKFGLLGALPNTK